MKSMSYEREIRNSTAEEIGFIVARCGWLYFPSPCLHLDTVLLSNEVTSANEDKFKIRGIVRACSGGAFLVLLFRIRTVTFKKWKWDFAIKRTLNKL